MLQSLARLETRHGFHDKNALDESTSGRRGSGRERLS
jgi:hypothetical protein